MLEKISSIFSKKAVEEAKKAIIEDVHQNKTGYIMAGITGVILVAGVVIAVKAIVNSVAVPAAHDATYTVTYNYYIYPKG